jgi:hypothetical protein
VPVREGKWILGCKSSQVNHCQSTVASRSLLRELGGSERKKLLARTGTGAESRSLAV